LLFRRRLAVPLWLVLFVPAADLASVCGGAALKAGAPRLRVAGLLRLPHVLVLHLCAMLRNVAMS